MGAYRHFCKDGHLKANGSHQCGICRPHRALNKPLKHDLPKEDPTQPKLPSDGREKSVNDVKREKPEKPEGDEDSTRAELPDWMDPDYWGYPWV